MNLVRGVISIFLLLLVAVSVAGWIWAGNQPPRTMQGARIVLGLGAAAAVGSLVLLWTAKQPQPS